MSPFFRADPARPVEPPAGPPAEGTPPARRALLALLDPANFDVCVQQAILGADEGAARGPASPGPRPGGAHAA
jgi:hypothetical protein